MIQTPNQRVFQVFFEETQFNFIQYLILSRDIEANHSIRSLISVSNIKISSIVE
ncbi:hypothetical protein Hanom_Chr09g00850591 [Helianthus anomalus]